MTITLADVYAAPHHARLRRTIDHLARRYFRHDPGWAVSAAYVALARTTLDPSRIPAWQVRHVGRNAMVDAMRRDRRRAAINQPMSDDLPTPTVDRSPDVRLRMRAVLAGLTPRERQIVARAADGVAGRDIAHRLGLTPGRVSQIRSAIRARI